LKMSPGKVTRRVRFRCAVGLFFLFLSLPHVADARQNPEDVAKEFLARSYHSPTGETMKYRLFVPPGYRAAKKYPIVLWLHNAAGRGEDNLLQISGWNYLGSHIWTTPENQAKFPAFVLAPQISETKAWARPHVEAPPESLRQALEILDAVEKEYSIDLDRVYVAGQSMGGEGVWAALAGAAGRFAAGIALCGYGFDDMIPHDATYPVWIFQGEADPIVPVARAREWVRALREAGGTPKYTEYPGFGHNVWERAFAEPDVVSWLMSQRRSGSSR
jgi:predicted peptidase